MSEYILKQKGSTNKESLARSAFRVGDTLYGYCQGIFGRDSYGNKRIISIEGDYIYVVEDTFNGPSYNNGQVSSWADLLESSNRSCEEQEEAE